MAPQYKLSYFAVHGLGEPIRLLFTYAGVDFENVRVEMKEWMTLKATMPFGRLPLLEVDGKKVHQSLAICRYLGKQFQLAGDNDWESMQIDIMADTIEDMRASSNDCFTAATKPETTADTTAKLRAIVMDETFPYYMPKLEEIVKKNNGYFANGKLSWVDFYWAAMMNCTELALASGFSWPSVTGKNEPPLDVLKDYPNLKALKERIFSLPAIKEWVANRPSAPF